MDAISVENTDGRRGQRQGPSAVVIAASAPRPQSNAALRLHRVPLEKLGLGYAAWEYSLISPPRIVPRFTGAAASSSSAEGA